MTYDEIINAVENGAKFTINFQKRTCRVNGKIVMSEEDKPKDTPYLTHARPIPREAPVTIATFIIFSYSLVNTTAEYDPPEPYAVTKIFLTSLA